MPRTFIKTVFGWHGTFTPVLQYSSEFKHSRHDWFWTHGSIDRNGIVLDTTEPEYMLDLASDYRTEQRLLEI